MKGHFEFTICNFRLLISPPVHSSVSAIANRKSQIANF